MVASSPLASLFNAFCTIALVAGAMLKRDSSGNNGYANPANDGGQMLTVRISHP